MVTPGPSESDPSQRREQVKKPVTERPQEQGEQNGTRGKQTGREPSVTRKNVERVIEHLKDL